MKQETKPQDTSTRKDEFDLSYDGNDNENYSIYLNGKDIGELCTDEDTAKAICTAVNETYGKGYNPAAMEELYKAFEIVLNNISNAIKGGVVTIHLKTSDTDKMITALQNAKTIKP